MSDPSKLSRPDVERASAAGAQGAGTAPSDHTTLTAVVDAYRDSGFVADFHAEHTESNGDGQPLALIRCSHCASTSDPKTAGIQSMRRLEGASDPADNLAVIATTCPVCGADGTLVVAYGPMADAADADVLVAMRDERGDDDVLPADHPPRSAHLDGSASDPDTSRPGST